MSDKLNKLCKELIELRAKSPFVPKEEWQFSDFSKDMDCPHCGEEVENSGFVVKSKDEHQAVDLHLFGMEIICKPQAEFICAAANNITKICEAAILMHRALETIYVNDVKYWDLKDTEKLAEDTLSQINAIMGEQK